MPKHRGTAYAVVRLQKLDNDREFDSRYGPTIVGVYDTMTRAEEVAGKSLQTLIDLGIHEFRFNVQTTVWYDE